MTNEEIEKEAARCVELTESDIEGMRNAYSEMIPCDLEARIARAIREAVSQAYEEAAREADEYGQGQTPPRGASCTDAKYIAMCIRQLKDSLVASPVS